MCVCIRELLREIDRTFKLQTLRSVSASLHLTPLIIAARKKRYNFPPRHYTLVPDRIPRFFCVRSDSPFNSRSSSMQLADRFPATHVYFASNLTRVEQFIPHYSQSDEWRERANRRGDKSMREKLISIFRSNPLVLRPESRLTRGTRADSVASVSRCV